MNFIESIGDGHEYANHQYEENNKFLESHVGSQRHDGNAITGEDITSADKNSIGGYSH